MNNASAVNNGFVFTWDDVHRRHTSSPIIINIEPRSFTKQPSHHSISRSNRDKKKPFIHLNVQKEKLSITTSCAQYKKTNSKQILGL